MKLFYKNQLLEESKELMDEFQIPGAEFTKILYQKMNSTNNVEIKCISGITENDSIKKIFILVKPGEYNKVYFSADGAKVLNKHTLSFLKEEYNLKDIKINNVENIFELENYINSSVYEKAHEILKDFYLLHKDEIVEDKLGKQYRLVVITNSDMGIGEHLHVDEVMLFDGNKEIGYLKAKYTTPEIMALHGIKEEHHFLNQATIDYSNIEEEYQNKGLGYVMYFHMAQHLNQKGIKFRQSTICSDSAELLWEKINEHWTEYVQLKEMNVSGKNKNVSFLSIGKNCSLSFKETKPIISKKIKP